MKASETTIAGNVAKEYLAKFPEMSSAGLAKLLAKNEPEIFSTTERARSVIRYYRGRRGNGCRNELNDRRFELPAPTQENPFSLPDSQAEDWLPFHLLDFEIMLVMGDIHLPYHDTKAITTAINYAIEAGLKDAGKKGIILLNGDVIDWYRLSKFEIDPRQRTSLFELDVGKKFLESLRTHFPEARIIYKQGNHDARYDLYVMQKAPELFGMSNIRYEQALDMFNIGVEYVDRKRPIYTEELTYLHGHEFWTSVNNPVNPARGAFIKAHACTVTAHNHQTSQHTEPNIRGTDITCWSIGCLCHLHPLYMPINKWNHGFLIHSFNSQGKFQIDNKRIVKGSVV